MEMINKLRKKRECTDKGKHEWGLVGMGTYSNGHHFDTHQCNKCDKRKESGGLPPSVTRITTPVILVSIIGGIVYLVFFK